MQLFSDLLTQCSLDQGIMLKALATAYRCRAAHLKEQEETWWACSYAQRTGNEAQLMVAQTKLALVTQAAEQADENYRELVQIFYTRGGTTAIIMSLERLLQAEKPNLDFVKSTIH